MSVLQFSLEKLQMLTLFCLFLISPSISLKNPNIILPLLSFSLVIFQKDSQQK